jgi:ferredoxin-NADP reductase
VLRVPDWPGHLPGQHVDVRLTAPDGYSAQRSYSIASAWQDGGTVELTVQRVEDGEVSSYLADDLQVGQPLELRGPVGGWFVWRNGPAPVLLVAGGSGIVPLMAMLRHRAAHRSIVPARLLYSSRVFEEIIYRQELEQLVAADPTLMVTHTLTRRQPPGWSGYGRRIDRAMLAEVGWPPSERPQAFVCGPTALVESVASALVELGHAARRVKTERFGPSGGTS